MISTLNMAAMLATGIITILAPIVLLTVWCIKKKVKLMPALAGVLIFMVFARTLEMIPHMFFIFSDNPVSNLINKTPLLYVLYGALTAGIFEETGRLTAFHFLRKNYTGKKNAITYGIGHGGFEAMSIVGFGFIQFFSIAMMINNGSMDTALAAASGDSLASLEAVVSQVSTLSVSTCLLSILERTYALVFHIALSVLVYHAYTVPGKKWLFPVAILLHAGLDLFAGLYQTSLISLPVTEVLGIIFTAIVAYFAYRVYKNTETDVEE